MLTIRMLGAIEVEGPDGRPLDALLAQTKRAALLAYLVADRGGEYHRRDTLLGLFWPELDQSRARHALSQALTFLRHGLPEQVLRTRGPEEVGVDAEALDCDLLTFRRAVTTGAYEDALALYRGDLMEGLHVAGASGFIDWLDRERLIVRHEAAVAAWCRAEALLLDGDPQRGEAMAERALDLEPTDETPARRVMSALAGAGEPGSALRFYGRFRSLLWRALEVEPARETRALADRIRGG